MYKIFYNFCTKDVNPYNYKVENLENEEPN